MVLGDLSYVGLGASAVLVAVGRTVVRRLSGQTGVSWAKLVLARPMWWVGAVLLGVPDRKGKWPAFRDQVFQAWQIRLLPTSAQEGLTSGAETAVGPAA